MTAWYQQPWLPFWRIDVLEGVDPTAETLARRAASNSETPILPALPFTEGNPRWVMLYDHAREGQIRPEKIRRLRRVDLEYLAATAQLPDTEYGHLKLEGNRARAQAELRRRDTIRATLIGAGVGVLAASIGWIVDLL